MVVGEHRIVDSVCVIIAVNESSKSRRNTTTTFACRIGRILELEGQHILRLRFSLIRRQDLNNASNNHAGVAQSGGGASLRN